LALVKFTDKFIKGLKAAGNSVTDIREGKGFGIRVRSNGTKEWFFTYAIHGRRRYLSLGIYDHVSLADAREAADSARKKIRGGIDPLDEKHEEEHEREITPTVASLVEDYLEKYVKKQKVPKSIYDDTRTLSKDVLSVWGKRKLTDIRKRDAIKLLETIAERAPGQANNVLKVCRAMWNWAYRRDAVGNNPFMDILEVINEIQVFSRDRHLSDEEIVKVWKGLNGWYGSDEIRRALKLILVTAQRPGEVIGMHSREIEGNWWTIPGDQSVNGKLEKGRVKDTRKKSKREKQPKPSHRVYLTPLAIELIGDKQGYIFESPKGGKPMTVTALSHFVKLDKEHARRTLEAKRSRNGKGKLRAMKIEKPGKLKEAQNAEKIACFGLESWTPHDLRRTAATKLSELQTPDFDIDMILGHVPAQVQAQVKARVDALQGRKKMGIIATYNQYQYDREKKKYLTDWSNCLLELLSQNNIPIHLQYVAPQEPPSQE
jgi:integrase